MTEFQQGDKVKVTFEATVTKVHEDGDRLWVYHSGVSDTYLNVGDVELIERKDDPSKDPIGTVRKGGGTVVNKYARSAPFQQGWQRADGGGAHGNDWVKDWPVIGAVPGSPAWDAWQKGELKGAPEFPGRAKQPLKHVEPFCGCDTAEVVRCKREPQLAGPRTEVVDE